MDRSVGSFLGPESLAAMGLRARGALSSVRGPGLGALG